MARRCMGGLGRWGCCKHCASMPRTRQPVGSVHSQPRPFCLPAAPLPSIHCSRAACCSPATPTAACDVTMISARARAVRPASARPGDLRTIRTSRGRHVACEASGTGRRRTVLALVPAFLWAIPNLSALAVRGPCAFHSSQTCQCAGRWHRPSAVAGGKHTCEIVAWRCIRARLPAHPCMLRCYNNGAYCPSMQPGCDCDDRCRDS